MLMNRRLLAKLCAVTMGFMVSAVPVTTVIAADQTERTNYNDGQVHEIDNVNVVTERSDNEMVPIGPYMGGAVNVSEGTTVNISGDVYTNAEDSTSGFPYVGILGTDYISKELAEAMGTEYQTPDKASEVNVEGSVTATDNAAVAVIGNVNVTVSGDVVSDGQIMPRYAVEAVGAYNFFREKVYGLDESVYEASKTIPTGSVSIGQDVKSESSGIKSYGTPVTVGGDVTATATGIRVRGGTVRVKGNVTGGEAAIVVSRIDDDLYDMPNDLVIVEGTIKATEGSAIRFNDGRGENAENKAYKFPDIVVYQIDGSNSDNIVSANLVEYEYDENNNYTGKSTTLSDEECTDAANAVLAAINYIIRTEGEIELSGDDLREYDGLYTMRYGETVTATVSDGYKVEGSDSVTLEKVGDGVYNIKLDSRLGGITLRAVVDNSGQNQQQIIADTSEQTNSTQWQDIMSEMLSQQDVQTDNNSQSDNSAPVAVSAPATESAAVVLTSSDSTALTPLSSDGTTPARGVSMSMTEMSPSQYQTAVVDNINNTPSGETLRIETDTVACLDSAMLESFAAKDIDLEVVFTYNGQKLLVTIPKGYDISKLLDEKGYCGFLRLASILGSKVV